MDKTYFLSQSTSLILVIVISLIFVFLGLYNSKKYQGLNNYLTANRNIGLFSLTTSLTASALGAWILFGPASAATWGGIGAIIGYSLGTAFPMFFLIFFPRYIKKIIGNAVPNEYPIIAPIPPHVAAEAGPNKIHAPKAEAVKLVVKENNPIFLFAVK